MYTLTHPGGPVGTYRLGIFTASTGATTIFATAFDAGTTYNLTLSYNFTSNAASLFTPGAGLITATDTNDQASVNRYAFRQATTHGDLFIDNLSVVPEPATYVLLGIGALVCAQRFRRKS